MSREQVASHAQTPAAGAAQNVLDQRWARRNGTRMRAQVQHPSLSNPLPCTILDTSSTGARLELDIVRGGQISRDTVPQQFTLVMPSERLLVDCEIAWRNNQLIGVRYLAPARFEPKPPPRKVEPPRKRGMKILAKIINPI